MAKISLFKNSWTLITSNLVHPSMISLLFTPLEEVI